MFDLTAHEIEILIDLTEIEMLAMRDGNFPDESEIASLKSCRAKLLKVVENVPGVTPIPFDEARVD
jgi:hypothetical protein